jgi:hypothetical protein
MCRRLSFHCLLIVLVVVLAWEWSERRIRQERARVRRFVAVIREDGHASKE